jgi:hypothetical protein
MIIPLVTECLAWMLTPGIADYRHGRLNQRMRFMNSHQSESLAAVEYLSGICQHLHPWKFRLQVKRRKSKMTR